MIHPDTEVRHIDEEIGRGVVAAAFIPTGTIIWVKDQLDREFSPEDLARFDTQHRDLLDRYSYRNSRGHYVFCWDHTRFMNHSFSPNCLPTPYQAEIAIRDIQPGEELTNDYGCLNIIEPFTPRTETGGRAEVRPDDLLRHSAEWDALLAGAFPRLDLVPQPLSPMIRPNTWERLRAVARGLERPASLMDNFFKPSLELEESSPAVSGSLE
ncbi:MAG: hypothetical protein ACI9VS_002140 [Candidatus Binatia bacterium]|jgi:hypothetical protein